MALNIQQDMLCSIYMYSVEHSQQNEKYYKVLYIPVLPEEYHSAKQQGLCMKLFWFGQYHLNNHRHPVKKKSFYLFQYTV